MTMGALLLMRYIPFLIVAPLVLYEDKMTLSQMTVFLGEGFVATGMFSFPGVALVILGVYFVRQNKSQYSS